MNANRLKRLLKSMIRRQPDRFTHLMQAVEEESLSKHHTDISTDQLAEWLAECIDDKDIKTEADIEERLATINTFDQNATAGTNSQSVYHARMRDSEPATNIRIPSEQELRKMAHKAIHQD